MTCLSGCCASAEQSRLCESLPETPSCLQMCFLKSCL